MHRFANCIASYTKKSGKTLQLKCQFTVKLCCSQKSFKATAVTIYYVKSFSGPYFPAFGLNTERYSVSLRNQSECGKIRTRNTCQKNFEYGHFLRSDQNKYFQLFKFYIYLHTTYLYSQLGSQTIQQVCNNNQEVTKKY